MVGETVGTLTTTEKIIWDVLTMPCSHYVCSCDHNIGVCVLMMIANYSVVTVVVTSFAASLSFCSI